MMTSAQPVSMTTCAMVYTSSLASAVFVHPSQEQKAAHLCCAGKKLVYVDYT